MKRVLPIILVALIAFAGILLALPSFIDWNKYRGEIVTQLENATGHHYEIAGGLSLAILPFPHVVVEKLSISAAKGEEPLAAIERVDVSVALMPLFKGKVDVSSVSLISPVVKLSVSSAGEPSWMTPVLKEKLSKKVDAPASGESVADAIALNDIRIKDGSFGYSDKSSGKTYAVKDIDLSVHGDTLFGPYNGEGSFEYEGQFIKFDGKTGKKSGDADSMAVQVSVKIPASSTSVSWSGVIATGERFEIQGETALDTANVGALMAFGGGKAPAGLDKPLNLRGILTASQQQVAFQNMKIGYAGNSGTGSVSIDNIAEGSTPVIAADLSMDGPVDAGALMPPSSPAEGKEKRFMPESVTLPREFGAKISFSAPSVSYAGMTMSNVKAGITYNGKTGSYEASGTMPGGAQGSESGTLTFGSMSKSAQTGAVTLSDPSLAYSFEFKADKAEETLKPVMAASPVSGKISAKGKGVVSQKAITIEEGSITAFGTIPVHVSGSYTLAKRDKVKISVAATQINLDKFMPPADPSAKRGTIEDAVKNIALPFDLDASWALEQVKLKERNYNRLAGRASLTGKKLQIASLEVKDDRGNSLAAAGSVGDITALKDIDVSMQGATADVPALVAEVTGKPASLPQGVKDGEVVAAFKGQPDKLDFTANLKAMNGTLDVSGVLADVLKVPSVGGLTMRLKHPNYVDLARLFSPDFKSGVGIKKSLDIFASMKREGSVYSLSELQADIGPAQVTGAVTADISGAKPSISAKIQAGDLPLDELLGHDVRQKGAVRSQPLQKSGQDSRWSRVALNNEWMHKFNLKLEGTAKSFSYGPWELNNAGLNVSLQDGTLTVTQIDGAMYGGQVALSGKAVSPAPTAPVVADGKVKLQDISLEEFVQAFSGSQLVRARGDISFDADVSTAGASPMALISGLNGKGGAKGSNLVFDGFDLAKMSRALAQPPGGLKEGFTSILDASMKGGSTEFDTLSSVFTINNGEVNISELTLTGPDATVTSPGRVNLPLWTLDMESTIQLAEPKDAPPLKAVFKGPLDNPGQTFAKSAMDGYVRNLIGAQVQDAILNKLEKKGALGGEKGQLIQGLIGGLTGQPVKQQQQPAAPQQAQPVEPAPAPVQQQQQQQQQAQPVQPVQQAPQPAPVQQQNEITPEDVFRGVLQGVLKGQ